MNHMQILKRAWKILWSYKALWIFGILLALTTGSYSGGGNSGYEFNNRDWQNFRIIAPPEIRQELNQLEQLFRLPFWEHTWRWLVGVGVALVCLAILVGIAFAFLHYISQTALIRMVDSHEQSGEKVTWRQGFRLGWSRAAWRLFLINLVITLPLIIVFIALTFIVALPVILSSLYREAPGAFSIILTIGLAFLFIFLAIVVAVALSMLLEMIWRVCVLRGEGVFASIRQGWQMLVRNFKNVALMWLILLGIRIGFWIVMIPVVILLVAVGILTGGGVGAVIFLVVRALFNTTAGWVIAGLLGGLTFITVFSLPLLFVRGLFQTYLSSTWTLTYRELDQLIQPAALEQPDQPGPEQPEKAESEPAPES